MRTRQGGVPSKWNYSSCESASCINGETRDQRDNLFDGITVTPTDDIMHPTIGGTYQHWKDDATTSVTPPSWTGI